MSAKHVQFVEALLPQFYLPFSYDANRHGVVGLTNQSNLIGDAVSVDEFLGRGIGVANASNPTALTTPLPGYTVGYRDPTNLRDVLNRIAPLVPAGDRFEYNVFSSTEGFVDYATNKEHIRAIGTQKFLEVKSSKTLVTGSVDQKGLTIFLDNRNGAQNAAIQQRYVQHLMDILMRTDLQETIVLLDANDTAENSVNFGPSNTSANPDKTLLALLLASGNARGIDSNVLVFGGGFASYRKQGILDAQRAGSTAGAYMTDEVLASIRGLDDVVTLRTRRQSAAATKAQVGGADAYAILVNPNATLEDASNVKRFYDPSAGADFTVFTEVKPTGVLLSVWHANKIVCPTALGIRKQPVTFT